MTVFQSTISQVVVQKESVMIRFRHPADTYVPRLTGYGFGADWFTPKGVRRLTQALCAAGGVLGPNALANKAVNLVVEDDGTLDAIAFPETQLILKFSDVCHA